MINDAELREAGGNTMGIMFAFLTGASLGVAAGLLLAPRTGKESREQLRDYWQKTREKVENAAREGAGMAREAVSKFRETATDAAEEIASSQRGDRSGMRKNA